MKKNTKFIYLSELILLIYLIVLSLFIDSVSIGIKNISTIVVLTLILALLLFFFGYKKDNGYLKSSSTRTVISSLMTFMIIIYSLGIILGFNRSYFNRNILVLVRNIMPILVITVELELIRYVVVRNSFDNKRIIVLFTILSSILNILLEINISTLATAESKFIFLSTIIFPILSKEALCSYMTYKIALMPSMVYKLATSLYIYILPIVPDLGNYIYSVANIILPFIIYNILNKMVIRYEKEKQELRKKNIFVFTFPIIAFLLLLIVLISGIFKYKMIAIASDSMHPTYGRGDAVIYEKVNAENLEVGNILVFQKDNIVVTHRIVKIYRQNGKYYYITKGDNNNADDTFHPSESHVLGKVDYAIKYIGYPTVLINEFFGKE